MKLKNIPGSLKVFSGDCCLCDVGMPVGHKDYFGKDLHTGDIVFIYHGSYVGTDLEVWTSDNGLTVIVAEQYQSFSNGTVQLREGERLTFAMGIKGCGFDSPDWRIHLVKKHSDVIEGEHWTAYGFRYAKNDAADALHTTPT